MKCVQMDSWVTNDFYSHFPSLSQQPAQREILAKARQLEYQMFLSRLTPKKTKTKTKTKNDGKALKRHTTNDNNCKRPKVPTTNNTPNDKLPKLDTHTQNEQFDMNSRFENKNRFQLELETMDLPDIFNDQMVRERNEKLAEEKKLKSVQYQQELLEQIERKRREKELQRAKEEEDEERLTKRVEEQLKMVRLQDELESPRYMRRRDQKLTNLETIKPIINQQQYKPPITVRSEQIELNTYRLYDERKAQSDRGKENRDAVKTGDKDIYNYFSNSAQNHPNQLKDFRYSHYFDSEDLSENDPMPNSTSPFSYNTYPSKSVRHQNVANKHNLPEIKQSTCNFCKHSRALARNQDENLFICDSCENEPICLNCRKEICVHCKRPTQEEAHLLPSRHLRPRNTDASPSLGAVKRTIMPQPKPKYVRTDNFHMPSSDDDESNSDPNSTDSKPFSFNINEASVFHPSKSRINRRLSVSIKNGEVFIQPDSFEELKRITDEKTQKFAKNYGDIWTKRPAELKESRIPKIVSNSKPMPSQIDVNPQPISGSPLAMRDNTKKLIEFAKELERGDNNIFQRTERKYHIPDAQINKVVQSSDTKTSTLTQIGAFKKQLQLDKLKF